MSFVMFDDGVSTEYVSLWCEKFYRCSNGQTPRRVTIDTRNVGFTSKGSMTFSRMSDEGWAQFYCAC